jgi:hypothetical protein
MRHARPHPPPPPRKTELLARLLGAATMITANGFKPDGE